MTSVALDGDILLGGLIVGGVLVAGSVSVATNVIDILTSPLTFLWNVGCSLCSSTKKIEYGWVTKKLIDKKFSVCHRVSKLVDNDTKSNVVPLYRYVWPDKDERRSDFKLPAEEREKLKEMRKQKREKLKEKREQERMDLELKMERDREEKHRQYKISQRLKKIARVKDGVWFRRIDEEITRAAKGENMLIRLLDNYFFETCEELDDLDHTEGRKVYKDFLKKLENLQKKIGKSSLASQIGTQIDKIKSKMGTSSIGTPILLRRRCIERSGCKSTLQSASDTLAPMVQDRTPALISPVSLLMVVPILAIGAFLLHRYLKRRKKPQHTVSPDDIVIDMV